MRAAPALLACLLAFSGCGGDDNEAPTVFAAASLTDAFRAMEPDARFNFAGSGELARQIRSGAKVDVYASADEAHAVALWRAGLLDRPRVLAANQVVLVVPRSNPKRIASISDLGQESVRLVIGARGVPIGDYTRRALGRSAAGRAALRNVVSEEPDVKSVAAKVSLGEADAGFVYTSDVRAAAGKLRAVYPAVANPVYAIAVVRDGDQKAASDFVHLALGRAGQRELLKAGFVTTSHVGDPLP